MTDLYGFFICEYPFNPPNLCPIWDCLQENFLRLTPMRKAEDSTAFLIAQSKILPY